MYQSGIEKDSTQSFFSENDICMYLVVIFPAIFALINDFLGYFLPTTFTSAIFFLSMIITDRNLRDALRLKSPSVLWFLFVPIYLYKRDIIDERKPYLFLMFIISLTFAMFYSSFINVPYSLYKISEDSCDLVTKIIQDEGKYGKCKQVIDIQKITDNNYYSAKAILTSGEEIHINIKVDDADEGLEVEIINTITS